MTLLKDRRRHDGPAPLPKSLAKLGAIRESPSIECPGCSGGRVLVADSRGASNGIRRRRICGDCGHRWSTIEVPADMIVTMANLRALRLIASDLDALRRRIETIAAAYQGSLDDA